MAALGNSPYLKIISNRLFKNAFTVTLPCVNSLGSLSTIIVVGTEEARHLQRYFVSLDGLSISG
jgi:hypothetical protein